MLLLRNATVIDGTGAPPKTGSILLKGNRIEALGPNVTAADCETIDCAGSAVAPGFIDIHSHSDLQVLVGRKEKLKQGVTLEVVGNCGFSPFPHSGDVRTLRDFGAGILGKTEGWGWPNAKGYLKALDECSSKDSALSLVGHGSLRIAVCGAAQDSPTQTQLDHMAGILDDSLASGCAGFSTGLMYAPGASAQAPELEHLCKVVAKRGKFYATHMRSYSDTLLEATREQISLAEKTNCRLQISHLQAAGRDNWQRQQPTLEEIEAAHARGVDVEFDIYPYQCGSTVLTQCLPQSALDGGNAALVKRLRDPDMRKTIWKEMKEKPRYWNDITISSVATAANEQLVGKTVEEIARLREVDPETCAMDILAEENALVNIVSFNQSEENLRQLITHKLCSVITDGFYVRGKAHPRLYGTYPELLGKLVRERKWLSLAEAVHKSTGKPAARLNLADRGILRPGNIADLVVFNPDQISSAATYDEPNMDPRGILHVIKNGAVA